MPNRAVKVKAAREEDRPTLTITSLLVFKLLAFFPIGGVCQESLSSSESNETVSKIQPKDSLTEGPLADRSDPANRQVQVRFLGFLERLAGQRETLVEIGSGETILDLLEVLCQRYGEEFSSSLFRAPGKVHTYLRIFLDEKEVDPGEGFTSDNSVTSKMELIILPIFEGGSR